MLYTTITPFVVPMATTSLFAQSKDQQAVSTISMRMMGSAICTAQQNEIQLLVKTILTH